MNKVINWLNELATNNKYEAFVNLEEYYDFKNKKIHQNVGSVYAIWIKMGENDLKALEDGYNKEATSLDGYYHLYFGKDIHPGQRIASHYNTSEGTGGLDLIKRIELHEKEIIWGSILVSKYEEFEKMLHEKFTPLLGSSSSGKNSSKTVVDN